MNKTEPARSREEILTTFEQLLKQYQQEQSRIETKEEQIAKTQNKELLSKTIDYTVDNIINGMASLRLNFGNVVGELAGNLVLESNRLDELKKAIAVEKEHLERLKQVRLVADALYIIEREHQAKTAILAANTNQSKVEIEQDISRTKKEWSREATEFIEGVREAAESIAHERERSAADYQYELKRQRIIEQDEYESDKRLQAIEIAELETTKNKDWLAREKYLVEHQTKFTEDRAAIATFEAKLSEEYGKAKGKAIKEAEQKYKVAAELREQEWLAIDQGHQLKIASLTTVVEHQTEQIVEITTQLQEANTQTQNLALQAFQKQ